MNDQQSAEPGDLRHRLTQILLSHMLELIDIALQKHQVIVIEGVEIIL